MQQRAVNDRIRRALAGGYAPRYFDLDFARVRERLYDIAASLHHVAPSGELLEPRRLLDAYESTAPEPLSPDEHRWLPGR
jgi:hypothetical protein